MGNLCSGPENSRGKPNPQEPVDSKVDQLKQKYAAKPEEPSMGQKASGTLKIPDT
tara:strand:- start:273 stop:437 length:165 start_codon:yes stop_codon:yes gene_type:complete